MSTATSTWSDKNARRPDGTPLSAEDVMRGVVSSDQRALNVRQVNADGTDAPTGSASDPVNVTGPLTNTQLRAAPVAVIPGAASATIVTVQTAATGSNWTAFGSQACTALDIVNTSGAAIEYRRGGAGNSIQIPTNGARMITGITNASSISVRRVDQSNTQVTVSAEALS